MICRPLRPDYSQLERNVNVSVLSGVIHGRFRAKALQLPQPAVGGSLAPFAFHLRYLVQAAAVALLALEAGAQERLHQLQRQL